MPNEFMSGMDLLSFGVTTEEIYCHFPPRRTFGRLSESVALKLRSWLLDNGFALDKDIEVVTEPHRDGYSFRQ